MKLRIQKRLFYWALTNEKGKVAAKIKNKRFIGPAKNIFDEKGNLMFTTDIMDLPVEKGNGNCSNSRKYMIYKNELPVATAILSFAHDPEQTKSQAFTLRLPQVEKMEVENPYGIWVIKRQKNNSLIITQNGVQLGSVTPFFNFKPIYLECSTKYETAFLAAIYILIEYMMHEDDLFVV